MAKLNDKNGIEIKTGDIVNIEGGFFKADNGSFQVIHTPGDTDWMGSDYCLYRINKNGTISASKHKTAFWPLMVTVSSRDKRIEAREHNKISATVEVVKSITTPVVVEVVEEVAEVESIVVDEPESMTEIAYNMGIKAFNEGKKAVPAQDENFLKTCLTDCKVGEGLPYIKAWTKGWHEMNLKDEVAEEKPSIVTVEAIAPTTTIQGSSLINESLAKRSKENMSFSDYKPGSATAEFNQEIAEVRTAIEKAKTKVSEEAQAKLDNLLASHTSRYAAWTNKRNANGAGHVSVMLAGPSNYNMSKHNKYLAKEGKLWAEYDEFKDIFNRINSIVAGDKIIKSNDSNAIDKLKEKLAAALEEHEGYKTYNAQARKEGAAPHMAYVLQNSNGRIKGIKDRIAHLERLSRQESKEIIVETESSETNGIRIVDNVEAHRLQIFFNGKPSAEIRTQLKKNGFRWTPSIEAWQSYRSDHASRAAQEIVSAI